MTTSRFFVANLPINTKEEHLEQLFRDYGEIQSIDIKSKENAVDPHERKIIAFVTLYITANEAEYCLKDLNVEKVKGQRIKVSLAKESFLERLKRERAEAKEPDDAKSVPWQPIEQQSDLLKASAVNKRKIFDEHEELDDDEVALELMINKKRAIDSMHNGRIFIPNDGNVQPLHVIDNKSKKKLAQSSDNIDEKKRKESLSKMKLAYEQKKSTIQKALQDENANISKRIVFSNSASDEESNAKAKQYLKTSKTNIFGSDDDEEGERFHLKPFPTGSRGEKLLQMQAKQSLDPRFHTDVKFLDEGNDDDEDEILREQEHEQNGVYDERKWQMNILEQVVGTKIDSDQLDSQHKIKQNKKMLRYDPSKDEHRKYERKVEEKEHLLQKNKTKELKLEEKLNVEVSKDSFYMVTDSLQQSLKKRGEGFSLLDMFGRNEVNGSREDRLKEISNEKILINHNKSDKLFQIKPFNYDSSSTDDDDEEDKVIVLGREDATEKIVDVKKNKAKIITETFFIPRSDIRLKEGFNFFVYDKEFRESAENYEDVRHRLKQILKTKITKAKKNLAKAGYRNKKRRKF